MTSARRDMARSLGQVAYEAYTHQHPATGITLPQDPWSDLWLDHQQAWQAAAEAVVDAASRGGPVGSPGAELADAIARAKVIKAAKAAEPVLEAYITQWDMADHPIPKLLDALEALQETEGE